MLVELEQVLVRVGESRVILGLEPPGQCAAQAGDPVELLRRPIAHSPQLAVEGVDALQHGPFVGCRQIVRARRGEHRVQALGDAFALLEPHAHLRVELAESASIPGRIGS